MKLKITAMNMVIVSLILSLGVIYNSVESVPTEIELSQNIQNAIGKFNTLTGKFIKDDLKPEKNALFSPLNIYIALSLLHLGASGATRNELSTALGMPSDEAEIIVAHKQLGRILSDLQNSSTAEVKIANSIFVQNAVKLKDAYLQATKLFYESEAQQVDFAKAGSEATDIVNNWVSNNTKKRIPRLFNEDIPHDTQLLLASTLLFNATWQKPFEMRLTKDEKFNTGGKQVAVKMMNQVSYIPYLKDEKSQVEAISLFYKNNEFSMVIILPPRNRSLGTLIDSLRPEHQQKVIQEFGSKVHYVDYKLPRFKFSWSQNMNNDLKKTGIRKIFENTELDNLIESSDKFKVSQINHATEIQVDEFGTIATAVSTVAVNGLSGFQSKSEPIKFHADRPFYFWIIHQKTGMILFTGIVQNPSVKAIILALFLVLGTTQTLVESAPKDQDLSQLIQNSVVKFNTLFTKFIKDDLKPEENVLFSPVNIYTALSLLQLGASGETRKELSNALGIPENGARFAAAHQNLSKILNDLQTTTATEVKIANSVFVQKGLKLKNSYLQAIKNYYQNDAQQVNFTKANSEARDIINNWVSNNTKNRIPELFKNIIPQNTRLILASTLFFNATWKNKFPIQATKDEKFTTGAKEVSVKMMDQLKHVPYLKNEKLQIEAISLPYENNEFSMAVILPYANKSVSAFIDDLKVDHQQEIIREFRSKNEYGVHYKIPRFKFAKSQSINNYVIKSGIRKIFEIAELDNLVESSERLKVSEINHATEIEVDETGSIATAVTTNIALLCLSEEYHTEPIEFYANRPFLFWIYHQKTGIILFSGIVQNPSV
ncbi:uncharacterized protein LOC135845234 [Planococcus citri]|uniref:uncharacterized protein LOC135845234 n=1 Tax=Planococcus citri TaxID=170843 RepID=UPI0031F8EF18